MIIRRINANVIYTIHCCNIDLFRVVNKCLRDTGASGMAMWWDDLPRILNRLDVSELSAVP